jgi:hypothetical protein
MAKSKSNPSVISSPALWVSMAAFLVSFASLVVSMQQTNIAKEQQKASVWPYLALHTSIRYPDYIAISIQNKGVGPAQVQRVFVQFEGKSYDDLYHLFEAMYPNPKFDNLSGSLSGNVLSAGETATLIEIRDTAALRRIQQVAEEATIEVYYDSVFGDTWKMTRDTVLAID